MRALRAICLVVGLVLASGAFVALIFLPWGLGHYSGEPEDTWVLAFWVIALGSLAATSFVVVWTIGRRLKR